jgi:hypothetical protein
MNAKKLFRRTYNLFRRWKIDRSCCADQDYMPSDAQLFRNAARRTGMDEALAARLAEACFSRRKTLDERLYELHDHVTGCIEAAREEKLLQSESQRDMTGCLAAV